MKKVYSLMLNVAELALVAMFVINVRLACFAPDLFEQVIEKII
ncbi:MAG: hypothetical protein Q4B86_06545 [Eubacteriales bacterium]|nr:hypothetical protein [Eubacteriales bacterium]